MDLTARAKLREAFFSKINYTNSSKSEELNPAEVRTEFFKKPLTINTGIEPYAGEWGDRQIAHLLRRVMFGVKKEDLDFFRSMTMEKAVDYLIVESPKPAPPVNDYNNEDYTDPYVPSGQPWVDAQWHDEGAGYRIVSLKSWLIKQMLEQPRSIHEKMLLFWHNHLVTQAWDVFIPSFSYYYFDMLRNNALGAYKKMIRDITLDQSMLLYLNGTFNDKEAPDENYGRELQELFCIGKGPNSNYTESDVQAAARVLTGWRLNWDHNFETIFAPWGHDSSDKQFSEFYNNTVIIGRNGEAGAQELDDFINMLFGNEELSLFICRKIYTYFVYNEIDEATEVNVIEPLAEIFRQNDYEIKPVLIALFKSAHFYDVQALGAAIKSPVDHLIGLWRTFDIPYPEGVDIGEKYRIRTSILWRMTGAGQEIGDPPSVAGWPAYYQTPSFDKLWINTETIIDRAVISDSFIYWGFWTPEYLINMDLLTFVKTLDNPGDPNALLEELSILLLGIDLTEDSKTQFKSILLSGQLGDYYWTDAWISYISDPNDDEAKMIVENRLKWLFQPLLQLGEYQLM